MSLRILCICTNPGPAESIVPLVKRLRHDGIDVVLWAASTRYCHPRFVGSGNVFDSAGIDYFDIFKWNHFDDPQNIPVLYLCEEFRKIDPDIVFVTVFRDASGLYTTIEDAAIHAAKICEIPSVQYCDLWDCWYPRKNRLIADNYMVFDNITKKIILTRQSIDENKITIVGNPSFEILLRKKKSEFRSKNSFELEKFRVIVYYSQPAPVDNELSLLWTLRCLKNNDRLFFARHPRDVREYPILREKSYVLQTDKESDYLLGIADVVITHFSTMAIKSALLGIPTINVLFKSDCSELRNIFEGYPLSKFGGSVEVHNETELRCALSKLKEPNQEIMLSSLQFELKSVEKMVAEILKYTMVTIRE